ncbi:MAG: DUF930 domain-containing protein [Nitratireductor sp.]|nr:DUF930 domain-containing protein [Nitratireductor sp.]
MLQAPERLKFDWGVPASLFAHAAIAALLIFGLPQLHHDPDEAQPINVELVPPPQTEEPPEPKQEEPEQAVEEEKPPEVEAPQPPPQSETAEAREKPMPPVLRPVFEFGEKDAGTPNAEGNAARDAQAEPAAPADEAGPTPEPLDEEADTTPQPPAAEMTDEPALLEADAPADETVDAELPAIPDLARIPVPEPAPKPPARRAAQGLPGTHFSQSDSSGPTATTAINSTPRGLRAGELCASVLREQLRAANPPYWPDLLPAYRLDEGTQLQVRKGAFRSNGQWYDLSFRCEVDQEATRVVSFSYRVGEPIPQAQWRDRGLPSR